MLLNCHTYYSFCYGTYSIKELLNAVWKNGYDCFVLSDINNTSACLDTIRLTQQKGNLVRPIAGIDFRNGISQQYVGIARNNEGFRELNEHLSPHLHKHEPFNAIAPEFSNAFVIYPLASYKGWKLKPHEFIGISINDLKSFLFSPYRHASDKLVVLHEVSFSDTKTFNAHRLLRAIDKNTLLSKLTQEEQASGRERMMPKQDLYAAYAAYPHMIVNTENLMKECSIHFEYGKLSNKNKKFYTVDLASDMQLLRDECMKGLAYRYPESSPVVMSRIEKELDVIAQKEFASYFLINWNIVTYARSKNYYYVGRGSGANSIIAYLLRITDVDPIELDLYFERFINIYRHNAPDFDIDFSWTDRDDITDYIFKTFNQNGNVALLGAYNTFQRDAVMHELGKVFGLSPGEMKQVKSSGERHPDKMRSLISMYSRLIHGFPSHLSVHSSGIIISEEPISTYSATTMPPKGFPTTQFSMLEAEDIGLYKFDILSQRGLGKIKDALEIVRTNRGLDIDIHDSSRLKQDPSIRVLLREGKTIGCFYVESPAMRMLLSKLRAEDYLRLVAASSIIRPGVSKSGMMREYIVRFRDVSRREKAKQELPGLYEILEETYGLMVYQEDVIKVAHLFAGISLAKADYLRRGMSWKFKERNEFSKVHDEFIDNCLQKGHESQLIHDLWNQIESFGNFAFSKGHSASYAVESYQALYLKAHFPLEYMVATLNNGGGFYRTELYIHEARMHGGNICLPCINRSTALCTIEGNSIYLGLGMIHELKEQTIRDILHERNENGLFRDLPDFITRVSIPIEQLCLLIRAGAFTFTDRPNRALLWEAHGLLRPLQNKRNTPVLFEQNTKEWKLPKLGESPVDGAFDEIALFGFSLSSPFALLKNEIPSRLIASNLKNNINRNVTLVGYLITRKTTHTSKGERMCFGTFLDLEGNWIDTVHFPPSLKQYPFTGSGCYELKGKVAEEYDFLSIEVEYMKRLPVIDREVLIENDPAQLPAG